MGNKSTKKFTVNSGQEPGKKTSLGSKSPVAEPAENTSGVTEGTLKPHVEPAVPAEPVAEKKSPKEEKPEEVEEKKDELAEEEDSTVAIVVIDDGNAEKGNETKDTNEEEEIYPIDYDGHEIDFYCMFMSPSCRAVMLAARIMGINLRLIECNVLKGDNKTPEFTEINPQQVVPTINDQGFRLWESRPIMTYFVNKYGKDDSLYPKDQIKRALVDQKLFFDIATLYSRLSDYYYPALFHDKEMNEDQLKRLEEGVEFLDMALRDKKFAIGDDFTVADIALVVTVSNLQALRFDFSKYPNILPWMERTEKELEPFGYEEINEKAMDWFENMYVEKILNKKTENENVEKFNDGPGNDTLTEETLAIIDEVIMKINDEINELEIEDRKPENQITEVVETVYKDDSEKCELFQGTDKNNDGPETDIDPENVNQ